MITGYGCWSRGRGNLAWVDLEKGQLQPVAEMPGFTRGLDFFGPLAFVGLSQVRETATFSGLPLTERLNERICGVWVIHIHTGETVAFLRFEEAVQEIFAVQVLAGTRFPEMLEWTDELVGHSYVLPDEVLPEVRPHPQGQQTEPFLRFIPLASPFFHELRPPGAEATRLR